MINRDTNEPIRCIDCKNFKPDTVGDGLGLGSCVLFNDYKSKNPSEAGIKKALYQLGCKCCEDFWGGTLKDRICTKYEEKRFP